MEERLYQWLMIGIVVVLELGERILRPAALLRIPVRSRDNGSRFPGSRSEAALRA